MKKGLLSLVVMMGIMYSFEFEQDISMKIMDKTMSYIDSSIDSFLADF